MQAFELLNIFVNGDLAAYNTFYAAHGSYVTDTLGLSHEDNAEKMRMLTLISLSSTYGAVPLDTIKTALACAGPSPQTNQGVGGSAE